MMHPGKCWVKVSTQKKWVTSLIAHAAKWHETEGGGTWWRRSLISHKQGQSQGWGNQPYHAVVCSAVILIVTLIVLQKIEYYWLSVSVRCAAIIWYWLNRCIFHLDALVCEASYLFITRDLPRTQSQKLWLRVRQSLSAVTVLLTYC